MVGEIKGTDIRKDIRDNDATSKIVQHRYKFLDEILKLLETHNAKIVGRIWVKNFGDKLSDQSIYTITAQNLCVRFQEYLSESDGRGILIADFRDPGRNSYVAHSIFTQKHKASGDAYSRLLETPLFGISNNHACLQLADFIATALLYPMAAQTYCKASIKNCFVNSNFDILKNRYRKRLSRLQFHCYIDKNKYWGITVEDKLGHKKSIELFSK